MCECVQELAQVVLFWLHQLVMCVVCAEVLVSSCAADAYRIEKGSPAVLVNCSTVVAVAIV